MFEVFNLNPVLCGGFSINNHSSGNRIRIENSKYGKHQVIVDNKRNHSLYGFYERYYKSFKKT